jgi:glutamine amidotransferase
VGRSVVVLDYGSGNLRSAERALARVGAEVEVTDDAGAADRCDGLVVPGVGAFAACMQGVRRVGGDVVVRQRVAAQRPVLGICVGMQVLFTEGDEHGIHTRGLGRLPGAIRRISAPVLPHMGWNTVMPAEGSVLFEGLADERFYFVHSYAARPAGAGGGAGAGETTAEHGETFLAAVENGALSATQFHPEKSGAAGAQLLRNWLATL